MDILVNTFELMVNVFEAFVLIHFIFSFHRYDYRSHTAKAKYAACSLGYASIVAVLNNFNSFEGFLGLIYVAYLFIISLIFLEGSVLSKLFSAACSNIIILFITVIVSNLVSSVFKDDILSLYNQSGIGRFVSIIFVQLLIYAVFDIVLKVINRNTVELKRKEWILIITILGISICASILIHSTLLSVDLVFEQALYLLIAEVCLILINIVCFYMTYALSKYHHETEELRIRQQRYDLSVQYAESVKNQYNEMRMIRHDMRQNYAVLEGLIEAGKTESALNYLKDRMDTLSKAKIFMDVGNDRINSILNSKLAYVKSNGIEVICSSQGDISGIDDADFCILLGNLFDNAIEGCLASNIDNKYLEAKLVGDDVKIRLLITNTACSEASEYITSNKTSKDDKNSHGFGLKSIQYIAEKYNGSVNYEYEDNCVICQVIMYK